MADSKTEKVKMTATQKILIIGISVLVLAVIGVGIMLFLKSNGTAPANGLVGTPGAGNVVVDEDNFEDVIAGLDQKAAEGMFEIKMNAVWKFPDGKSPSADASVANSTANKRSFYFELALEDSEELLYTSPVIPVGSRVTGFSLEKELAAGTYACVCTYRNLNEDGTIANSASVGVTVIIEK